MQGGAQHGGCTLVQAGQGRVSQVVHDPGKALLAMEGFAGTLRGFQAGEQRLQKQVITQQDPGPVWVPPREAPGPGLKAGEGRGQQGEAAGPWSALPGSPERRPSARVLTGVPARGPAPRLSFCLLP